MMKYDPFEARQKNLTETLYNNRLVHEYKKKDSPSKVLFIESDSGFTHQLYSGNELIMNEDLGIVAANELVLSYLKMNFKMSRICTYAEFRKAS